MLVIAGVLARARGLTVASDNLRQNDDVLEPEFGFEPGPNVPADLWVADADPAVLKWAAGQRRVLVTHDVSTLGKPAHDRAAEKAIATAFAREARGNVRVPARGRARPFRASGINVNEIAKTR